ncbi:MAG: DMT family transporter [Hyphomicrobiales bacterium]|nr:MAG: DMT family transporter [Hyphomicrobiales bacterium]
MGLLWAVFTVIASAGQVARNAMQRELTQTLGTVGATQVRFLFGLPFAIVFLGIVMTATRADVPALTQSVFLWALAGAVSQIGATALLLAAMRDGSFVVATAYSKTEPVQVAVFGLVFLGDHVTWPVAAAILVATAGVLIVSWPQKSAASGSKAPAVMGIASGALFAVAAIGFRGAIRAVETPSFVVAATVVLVLGLALQTAILMAYMLVADRATMLAIFRAWRPSLMAGFAGAFASQMWFLAFAIETAAKARTLALIEILFAQIVSRNLFKQNLASREALGIGLIIVGVIVLLNT